MKQVSIGLAVICLPPNPKNDAMGTICAPRSRQITPRDAKKNGCRRFKLSVVVLPSPGENGGLWPIA